jgi:hypothetical protein
MTWITAFARFWWDFIVGDDWISAAGVVAGIAVTAALAHHGVNAWILMPVVVLGVMYLTLRRATR